MEPTHPPTAAVPHPLSLAIATSAHPHVDRVRLGGVDATVVLDVVGMVDVAFRNADAAQAFCDPCP